MSLLLFIALYFLPYGVSASYEWSYHDEQGWGGVCETGKNQSPVNIKSCPDPSLYVEPLLFIRYDKQVSVTLSNNGHTVVMKLQQPCDMAVAAGGLRGFYVLDHLHFHWNSEHTIDDKSLPLEVHLVHYNNIFPNISVAMTKPKGLAVVGVLFHEDEDDYDHMNPVLEKLPEILENTGRKSSPMHYHPGLLIPKRKDQFYRYEGSLTTPPCSETVVWTIMKETVPISSRQVASLKAVNLSHGIHKTNYRRPQPLNGRTIELLSSQVPMLNDRSSSPPTKTPSFYLFIFFYILKYTLC